MQKIRFDVSIRQNADSKQHHDTFGVMRLVVSMRQKADSKQIEMMMNLVPGGEGMIQNASQVMATMAKEKMCALKMW